MKLCRPLEARGSASPLNQPRQTRCSLADFWLRRYQHANDLCKPFLYEEIFLQYLYSIWRGYEWPSAAISAQGSRPRRELKGFPQRESTMEVAANHLRKVNLLHLLNYRSPFLRSLKVHPLKVYEPRYLLTGLNGTVSSRRRLRTLTLSRRKGTAI